MLLKKIISISIVIAFITFSQVHATHWKYLQTYTEPILGIVSIEYIDTDSIYFTEDTVQIITKADNPHNDYTSYSRILLFTNTKTYQILYTNVINPQGNIIYENYQPSPFYEILSNTPIESAYYFLKYEYKNLPNIPSYKNPI